jgi:hypothetical protein
MPDEEKRKYTRIPFETTVRITVGDRILLARHVRDVSLGGVFVCTAESFSNGTVCDLEIELKGPGTLLIIHAEGEVTRVEPEGMGLRFTGMDLDGLIHLRHLIRIYAHDPEVVDLEYADRLLGVD